MPGDTAAQTQQIEFKSRQAGGIGCKRPRGRRAHTPARSGGALRWRSSGADHDNGHTGFSGRERQAAACFQVEKFGFAPECEDDSAEPHASCGLLASVQTSGDIADTDKNDAVRVEPHLAQAGRVEASRFGVDDILPDNERGAIFARHRSQRQGKAGGGHRIGMGGCIQFMQCPTRQPAAQCLVDGFDAKRYSGRPWSGNRSGRRIAVEDAAFQGLPQGYSGVLPRLHVLILFFFAALSR